MDSYQLMCNFKNNLASELNFKVLLVTLVLQKIKLRFWVVSSLYISTFLFDVGKIYHRTILTAFIGKWDVLKCKFVFQKLYHLAKID